MVNCDFDNIKGPAYNDVSSYKSNAGSLDRNQMTEISSLGKGENFFFKAVVSDQTDFLFTKRGCACVRICACEWETVRKICFPDETRIVGNGKEIMKLSMKTSGKLRLGWKEAPRRCGATFPGDTSQKSKVARGRGTWLPGCTHKWGPQYYFKEASGVIWFWVDEMTWIALIVSSLLWHVYRGEWEIKRLGVWRYGKDVWQKGDSEMWTQKEIEKYVQP